MVNIGFIPNFWYNKKIQTNVLVSIDTNKCLVYYNKVERQNKKKALISVLAHHNEIRTSYIMI